MHNILSDIFSEIYHWFAKSIFLIITVAMTAISNYFLHVKIGKEDLNIRAFLFSVVLSFTLAMVAASVWTSIFGPKYETAIAVAVALVGKEFTIWIIVNRDRILTGIAEKFGIKMRKK